MPSHLPWPTEDEVSEAIRVLTRDYRSDVESIANSIEQAIQSREITCESDAQEYLDQSVDGTQRVIYTWQARCGLLVSENADAYFEEMGEQGAVQDGDINWSALMYMALRADVLEELRIRGVDLDSEAIYEPPTNDEVSDVRDEEEV